MARGHHVSIVDRAPCPAGFPCDEWKILDIETGADDLAAFARGHDTLIYLASASLPASAMPSLATEVVHHVGCAMETMELCLREGVRRIVFASSGGTVYGSGARNPSSESDSTAPITAYGASKLAIEGFLRVLALKHGIAGVALRISNPYGRWQRAERRQGFIAAAIHSCIENTPLTIWGDGSVVRDFVYANDVADCFLDACAYEGEPVVVNVGSGKGYSLKYVLGLLNSMTSRPIAVSHEPGRSVDLAANVLNVSLAKNVFGWTPRVDLETGLGALLQDHGLRN